MKYLFVHFQCRLEVKLIVLFGFLAILGIANFHFFIEVKLIFNFFFLTILPTIKIFSKQIK